MDQPTGRAAPPLAAEPAVSRSFLRNIFIMVLGTGAAHVVALALLPLLMRLYRPEAFGVAASCISAATIIATLSLFSYQRAIPLSLTARMTGALLGLCLVLLGLFFGITLVGLAVIGERGGEWLTSPGFAAYRWLIPVAVLFLAVQEILTMWTVREKQFTVLARSRLAQGLGTVVAQLALGVWHLGALGLLLGDVLARGLAVVTLGVPFGHWWRDALSGIRLRSAHLRAAAARYRRFAVVSTPAFFLNRCAGAVPILLLANCYGAGVAGWWGFAERVLTTPLYWLGDSVAQVYYAEAARLRRAAPERLYRLFLATAGRLFLVGVGPLTLVCLCGPTAFALAFGNEWREAGVYARWLSLSVLLQFTVSPLSHTLNVLERQQLQLLTDVVLCVLRIGSLALAAAFGLSAPAAIGMYVAAQGVGYAAQFALLTWVLADRARGRQVGIPPRASLPPENQAPVVVPARAA